MIKVTYAYFTRAIEQGPFYKMIRRTTYNFQHFIQVKLPRLSLKLSRIKRRFRRKALKHIQIHNVKSVANLKYQKLDINRTLHVTKPKIIYTTSGTNQFLYGKIELPELYIAEFAHVKVIEGTDLVLMDKLNAAYDELTLDPQGKYGLKIGYVPLITKMNFKRMMADIFYYASLRTFRTPVIHFLKEYSSNYFHWLVECLPRLLVIEGMPQYNGLPLLVDKFIPNSHLQALRLMTGNSRKIIRLEQRQAAYVHHLIYPSPVSYIYNNYDHEISYDSGVEICYEGIQYVRSKIFNALALNPQHGKRKLYLSRKKLNEVNERLKNSIEIEEYLKQNGFEVIYPERLSFVEQVRIFADAAIVVAPAGAALSNLIFAPPNCKVFAFCTNNRFNPYIFHLIAQHVGITLYHVIGEEAEDLKGSKAHNPFKVNLEALKNILDPYITR